MKEKQKKQLLELLKSGEWEEKIGCTIDYYGVGFDVDGIATQVSTCGDVTVVCVQLFTYDKRNPRVTLCKSDVRKITVFGLDATLDLVGIGLDANAVLSDEDVGFISEDQIRQCLGLVDMDFGGIGAVDEGEV